MVILYKKNNSSFTNKSNFNQKSVHQKYNIKRFKPKTLSRKSNFNGLTSANRKFLKSLGVKLKP